MIIPSKDDTRPVVASTHAFKMTHAGISSTEISGIQTLVRPQREGPAPVFMADYVDRFPVRNNDMHWILDPGWAVAFNALQSIPFWFNTAGRRVCIYCDGRSSLGEIIEHLKMDAPPDSHETIAKDTLVFLLILSELDLVTWKDVPR